MHNIYLQTLHLESYRNFKRFEICSSNHPILLVGENGTGKTNILEAVSLLSAGRGLRAAKLEDICKTGSDYWSIRSIMHSKLGIAEINTNFMRASNKRYSEFNGSKIQNNELSKLSSIIWLSTQLDGIFVARASDRRRFFDRIIYNLEQSHAVIMNKYEYYIQERSKILEQDSFDLKWIQIIEEKISELALVIANNRIKILAQLQQSINEIDSEFPKAKISLDGVIEEKLLSREPEIIDFIKNQFYITRHRDKISKRTNFGPHRSDFVVIHQDKNILAKLCSTGEQKAMLITIILAQINNIIKEFSVSPIILLDELFAHLDNKRKQYLVDFFKSSNMQIWITTANLEDVPKLSQDFQVIRLE